MIIKMTAPAAGEPVGLVCTNCEWQGSERFDPESEREQLVVAAFGHECPPPSMVTHVRDAVISCGYSAENADRMMAEVRAEVLREAADEMDAHCEKYGVLGVGDRLRRMAASAASGTPAGGERPESAVEFGVRTPSGVLTPTHDREAAEQRLARHRDMHPTAALVQRTIRYGAWTEVTS